MKAPECPECTGTDADRPGDRWYCRTCGLVYTGTQAEWDAHRLIRARRAMGLNSHVGNVERIRQPAQAARRRIPRVA